jgi:putative endonuclease
MSRWDKLFRGNVSNLKQSFKKNDLLFVVKYRIMFYVYILQSITNPDKTYIGYTNNLTRRLNEHNSGKCTYSSAYKPWKIICYTAFLEQEKAIAFEKYLKTSSGKTLLNQRFL